MVRARDVALAAPLCPATSSPALTALPFAAFTCPGSAHEAAGNFLVTLGHPSCVLVKQEENLQLVGPAPKICSSWYISNTTSPGWELQPLGIAPLLLPTKLGAPGQVQSSQLKPSVTLISLTKSA